MRSKFEVERRQFGENVWKLTCDLFDLGELAIKDGHLEINKLEGDRLNSFGENGWKATNELFDLSLFDLSDLEIQSSLL